eukprot:scaffold28967_cov66-Phaeocystis_antarctica.AAC.2
MSVLVVDHTLLSGVPSADRLTKHPRTCESINASNFASRGFQPSIPQSLAAVHPPLTCELAPEHMLQGPVQPGLNIARKHMRLEVAEQPAPMSPLMSMCFLTIGTTRGASQEAFKGVPGCIIMRTSDLTSL